MEKICSSTCFDKRLSLPAKPQSQSPEMSRVCVRWRGCACDGAGVRAMARVCVRWPCHAVISRPSVPNEPARTTMIPLSSTATSLGLLNLNQQLLENSPTHHSPDSSLDKITRVAGESPLRSSPSRARASHRSAPAPAAFHRRISPPPRAPAVPRRGTRTSAQPAHAMRAT